MKDIVGRYIEKVEMKHILFTDPFLWDNINSIDIEDTKVAWLLAVPISEKEYLYAQEKGTDALEKFFEFENIDIFDLNRKSIL